MAMARHAEIAGAGIAGLDWHANSPSLAGLFEFTSELMRFGSPGLELR